MDTIIGSKSQGSVSQETVQAELGSTGFTGGLGSRVTRTSISMIKGRLRGCEEKLKVVDLTQEKGHMRKWQEKWKEGK